MAYYIAPFQWMMVMLMLVFIGLRGSPSLSQEDEEEEQEIQEILRQSTLRPLERVENLPPFPVQSESVASFIREHMTCKEENVAIFLLQSGFRHTVLLANLIGEELIKKEVPTIGIIKGERAMMDAELSSTFKFPVIFDTTISSDLFGIFGVKKGSGNIPGWLTVWSCSGELRFYFSLFQPHLKLDSIVRLVRYSRSLSPALKAVFRPSEHVVIAAQGYSVDSITHAYPRATLSNVITIPENAATPLGWARLRVSPSGRWFYFSQTGLKANSGLIFDLLHQKLIPLPIDSLFFRNLSQCSDSIFYKYLHQNYLQAIISEPADFSPCSDSTLIVPISYAQVYGIRTEIDSTGDTTHNTFIGKSNWSVLYNLNSTKVLTHIPEYDSSSIARFGFIDKIMITQRSFICNPPLYIGTIRWNSYPRSHGILAQLLQPNADSSVNPISEAFFTMARQWAIFDSKTGACLALGGKINKNKQLLGIGYAFNPLMEVCHDAAIIHEPLTDYVELVPDGIRRPIKTYYAPEIVHPTKQARYPATPSKIYRILAGARAWPKAIGITSKEYALVWDLYEAGRDYDDSHVPFIWQRYDRSTGKLIGEWLIPRIQDGMNAQSMDFDGEGYLYVLYQDYRRSHVYKFNNQP